MEEWSIFFLEDFHALRVNQTFFLDKISFTRIAGQKSFLADNQLKSKDLLWGEKLIW